MRGRAARHGFRLTDSKGRVDPLGAEIASACSAAPQEQPKDLMQRLRSPFRLRPGPGAEHRKAKARRGPPEGSVPGPDDTPGAPRGEADELDQDRPAVDRPGSEKHLASDDPGASGKGAGRVK